MAQKAKRRPGEGGAAAVICDISDAANVSRPDDPQQGLSAEQAPDEVVAGHDQGRLTELADKIRREHTAADFQIEQGLLCLGRGLDHKITVGKLLIEARAAVGSKPRGAWRRWIEENLPFGIRQARRYLAAADLTVKRTSMSALDLDDVRMLLEDPLDSELPPLDLPEDELPPLDLPEPPPPAPPPGSSPPPAAPSSPPEPPPLTVDQRRADEIQKKMLTALGILDQLDPEKTAADTRDPELLREQAWPVYEKLRQLVNALDARLKVMGKPLRQTPQLLPFLGGGMLDPPPIFERIDSIDPIVAAGGPRDLEP